MGRKVRNVWPVEGADYCVDERGRLYKGRIGPIGLKYYQRSDGKNFEYRKRRHLMIPTGGFMVWDESHPRMLAAACLYNEICKIEPKPKPKRPSSGNGTKLASGIASAAIGFWSGLNKK